jgi:uncharacterized protein with GYD domain
VRFLPKYLVLVKIDPNRVSDVVNALKGFPETPTTGVTLYHTYNLFGEWDACLWFDADTQDNAMNFVQTKICPIKGVINTYTMPTTPIKEYKTW